MRARSRFQFEPRPPSTVRYLLVVCLVCLATATVLPGNLLSVNPTGASSGVVITLTGTGFDTIASRNVVTFTPTPSGASRSSNASTVATIDPARGIRRLTVTVPDGLPVGRADLKVQNTTT